MPSNSPKKQRIIASGLAGLFYGIGTTILQDIYFDGLIRNIPIIPSRLIFSFVFSLIFFAFIYYFTFSKDPFGVDKKRINSVKKYSRILIPGFLAILAILYSFSIIFSDTESTVSKTDIFLFSIYSTLIGGIYIAIDQWIFERVKSKQKENSNDT